MRLTAEQAAIISSAAAKVIGSDARVEPLGTRTDDDAAPLLRGRP